MSRIVCSIPRSGVAVLIARSRLRAFAISAIELMINDNTWTYVGAGVVVGGLLLIYLARSS